MANAAPALSLAEFVEPTKFLREALAATHVSALEGLLRQLPVVPETDYFFDPDNPAVNWRPGHLHWMPLGRDTGNAGRVRLASRPENPLAERAINAMEAVVEMRRLQELKANPSAAAPRSPRDAVERYFGLPPLPELARLPRNHELRQKARALADLVALIVDFDKSTREFTVQIRDHGMGQTADKIHRTILSLGASDKGDKPYLIGVFGQGGSSAYMASPYSWCVSRRAPGLDDTQGHAIGWTAVKHVYPSGRRDDYFAYLAAAPDGRVPFLPASAADAAGFTHGTLFTHLRYDFSSTGGSAISRTLFQSLNHVLYNPVLPIRSSIGGTSATIWGNAFRLADATARQRTAQDKSLPIASV